MAKMTDTIEVLTDIRGTIRAIGPEIIAAALDRDDLETVGRLAEIRALAADEQARRVLGVPGRAMHVRVIGASSELERCALVIDELRKRGVCVPHDWPRFFAAAGGDDRKVERAVHAANAEAGLADCRSADLVLVLVPRYSPPSGGTMFEAGVAHEAGAALVTSGPPMHPHFRVRALAEFAPAREYEPEDAIDARAIEFVVAFAAGWARRGGGTMPGVGTPAPFAEPAKGEPGDPAEPYDPAKVDF